MNLSIRQLQIFVHVYRAGNLTRAATQLGLTQSAVSLQLRQLEDVFGLRLFDRTTRAVHPTGAATEAVAAAEQILTAASGLTNHMRNLNDGSTGKVTFAASAGFASTFMPPILATFHKFNPGIDVVFYDVPAHHLVDRLLTTEAEFALGSVEGEVPDVSIEPILKGRLSAVGIDRGAFAAKKQIAWDDLAAFPTIAMRRETMIRINIDAALARFGKSFVPTYEVSLFNTALSMTAAGLGVSILPDYIVLPRQFPTLVAKPLVRPALDRQVSLIRVAGRSLSPAATRFVAQVRTEFSKLSKSKNK
ncbi:LysR family transcriptional regulator [Bradyrhizobium sp. LHD-71]|uniref:LysR family transcriptional regulator n=1 Tax=Bradyrhizobium sp. LHD-71 TaxID=3072141 RepID=UPI00280CDC63|nr:LysR family transcriptional regulator [Bradyrhizobium sp. LHD-71]MDQ8726594.1 LysR family transcriptional regulator [Bradyrhizobium sp. LHD-71]